MTPSPPPAGTLRWTAARSIGAAIALASLGSLAVLWGLSWRGAEDAVVTALSDQLVAQASLVGDPLHDVPLSALVGLGTGHASQAVQARLDRLQEAAGLHDVALLGPTGTVLGSEGDWLPLDADADLVARARSGAPTVGPLYRATDGALYLTAYAPVPDQAGWVVAVEGSATLGAVDALAQRQAGASLLVLLLVSLLGGALAHRIARPLRQLREELAAVVPGDPAERVTARSPAEVHDVALAARSLLDAIQQRDRAVADAHADQLAQLERLAAEVAHEVRNPLNAMQLSVARLPRLDDPERRATVARRLQTQLDELEGIASRLVDLTRPLAPAFAPVDLAAIVAQLHAESDAEVRLDGPPLALVTDGQLLTEVLRNLVLNAHQAGARSIVLRADDDGLEIVDDGPGIDDPAVLFDWFRTTRAQGSGIGLPVSRRIVEALGGQLELVRPRPATFRIQLPRRSA